MKKTIILILLSMLLAVIRPMDVAASDSEKVFAEVAKMPEVESVFVGGAILKFASGTRKITSNKYTSRVRNIEAIEIISCDDKDIVPKVAAACKEIIDNMKLEVILEANENKSLNDSSEKSMIYGGPIIEGNPKMKNMIVVNQSSGDYELVYIKGDIDISDVID